MTIIYKAGAIVVSQKDPTLVALLYRGKQKDWSFPKGHVKDGESMAETARREVMEEMGFPARLINGEFPLLEYDHPRGNHIIVGIFFGQSEDDAAQKIEFEGDRIVWVPYKEVVDRLSYNNIKQYYISVFGQIEKLISTLQSKIH